MQHGVTILKKSVTETIMLTQRSRLLAADIPLISMFAALFTVLNLTIGPLGFAWFGLPVFCDFAVYFTLLLTVWIVGKFGAASLVGIIGSALALLLRAQPFTVVFAAAATLFDITMIASRHRLRLRVRDMTTAVLATAASAYFAGVIIGVFFLNRPYDWALTFWGGWHLAGGILTLIVALPVIGILERSGVRRLRNA